MLGGPTDVGRSGESEVADLRWWLGAVGVVSLDQWRAQVSEMLGWVLLGHSVMGDCVNADLSRMQAATLLSWAENEADVVVRLADAELLERAVFAMLLVDDGEPAAMALLADRLRAAAEHVGVDFGDLVQYLVDVARPCDSSVMDWMSDAR